jgi:hypothetical protein
MGDYFRRSEELPFAGLRDTLMGLLHTLLPTKLTLHQVY